MNERNVIIITSRSGTYLAYLKSPDINGINILLFSEKNIKSNGKYFEVLLLPFILCLEWGVLQG